MAKLIVVPRRDLKVLFFGQVDERLCVSGVKGERLFNIDVTSILQTLSSKVEMALWRCRNMDNIRTSFRKEFTEIAKVSRNSDSVCELLGHQLFTVTNSDDLASWNTPDL
jgi:hypothetical protein